MIRPGTDMYVQWSCCAVNQMLLCVAHRARPPVFVECVCVCVCCGAVPLVLAWPACGLMQCLPAGIVALQLSAEELGAALRDLRVNVSPREVAELLAYFDTDHSGKITLAELEAGLRPVLPEGRLKIVKQAFSRADRGGDGAVTVEDLARLADVSKHPDVVMGGRTERQVLEGFLSAWDRVPDGRVTLDEFVDYYTDVSSMIEDDAVFEQMVRGCWQLPGAAGSGPALRVRVTHNDSSQEVVEVSSAGVTRDDLPLIRALLRKAGVKSIHSVQVL